MILPVSPDASTALRVAAAAILYLHIGGASIGMIGGFVAILARKGERLHRAAGNVFFAGMLLMSVIGAVVSPFLPQRIASVAGGLAFYLVLTGWMTVKRAEGRIGRLESFTCLVGLAVLASALVFGWMGATSPDGSLDHLPWQPAFIFAALAAIGVASDLSVIRQGGVTGRRRVTRHAWRMSTTLLIAAVSFVGQPKAIPESWRGSPWLFAPVVIVLALTLFWTVRARFTNAFGPAVRTSGARARPDFRGPLPAKS